MLNEWISAMRAALPNPIITLNEPLRRWTTFRVGGPADAFYTPASEPALALALRLANQTATPVLILGNGSNILVRDSGFRGLVLRIGADLANLTITPPALVAGAGTSLTAAAQYAARQGLGGLAELSGIPGTIGGATVMNAGAYGSEMSQLVSSVTALTPTGEHLVLASDALAYRYRGSAMLDQGLIVTQVELTLTPEAPDAIRVKMADYATRRREKQPLTLPSAGSFFKRPVGDFAGRLIEAAGLKGTSVGGAQVSTLHAGFLVNRGDATAADILALMRMVQTQVQAHSGVWLEPEVRIVGEE